MRDKHAEAEITLPHKIQEVEGAEVININIYYSLLVGYFHVELPAEYVKCFENIKQLEALAKILEYMTVTDQIKISDNRNNRA